MASTTSGEQIRDVPGQIMLQATDSTNSRTSAGIELSSIVSRGSSSHSERRGETITRIRRSIQPHVSTLVFPRKQFVVNVEMEFPPDKGAATMLKRRLNLQNLSEEEWKQRWERSYREATRQALKMKRNNVAGDIRRAMKGNWGGIRWREHCMKCLHISSNIFVSVERRVNE